MAFNLKLNDHDHQGLSRGASDHDRRVVAMKSALGSWKVRRRGPAGPRGSVLTGRLSSIHRDHRSRCQPE
jgi:hypothetical protein